MGKDIHVHVCKRFDDGKLFELKLFKKEDNMYKEVPAYEGRKYELFNALEDGGVPAVAIHTLSLDDDLSDLIAEDTEAGCFGFRQLNLADLFYFLNNKHSLEKEELLALQSFIDSIRAFINFSDPYGLYVPTYSDYYILYWFDN